MAEQPKPAVAAVPKAQATAEDFPGAETFIAMTEFGGKLYLATGKSLYSLSDKGVLKKVNLVL